MHSFSLNRMTNYVRILCSGIHLSISPTVRQIILVRNVLVCDSVKGTNFRVCIFTISGAVFISLVTQSLPDVDGNISNSCVMRVHLF
jgi:hypothetical protein